MTKHHIGIALAIALFICTAGSALCVDTFIDSGAPGIWGATIKPGSNTQAVVQPFVPWVSGWANRIGIGLASGSDPNHVGFNVTMTDVSSMTSFYANQLPGTPLTESWTIMPATGAALSYAYVDIDPIFLDCNKTYGLIVEPGDDQMYGSVAFCWGNVQAWKTSDNWATKTKLDYRTAIRIYGTAGEVPEPSSLLALICGIGGFGGTLWRRNSAKQA